MSRHEEYEREYTPKRRERKTLITEEPVVEAPVVEDAKVEQTEDVVEQPVVEQPVVEEGGEYPAFTGDTIVTALKNIGEDWSFDYRIKLAKANGMPNYYGRPDQNAKLLHLAREGKLKKA